MAPAGGGGEGDGALDVDAAVDALFDHSPEEFTPARDALVRQLRAVDKEAAAAVKSLRKPTVAAWAVNQAVRHTEGLADELAAAGTATRRAQQALLSGRGSTAVRDATAQRRAAVRRGTEAASSALAAAGRLTSDAVRDAISATFDAAVLDEEALAGVRRARLSKELEAEAGLGDVGGLTLLTGGRGREDGDGDGAALTDDDEGADRAAADERAARDAERRRLEGLAERAEAAAERAGKELSRAQAEVERIESDLAKAQDRLARAEHDAVASRGAAAEARKVADAAVAEDPG